MAEAILEKAPVSMKEFYQRFGLKDYPFNVFTAENEIDYAQDIFVHPQNYDAIKESFDGNRSIIIRGNRGTGKTALLNDLKQSISASEHVSCTIDDYSKLSTQPTTAEYYNLIIVNIVAALFNKLFEEKNRLKCLSKEEKLFVSFLLQKYTNQITQAELIRKIEKIQLPPIKRFLKSKIDVIRAMCNYGINAGLNVVNDVIRNYYSVLPPIQESQIREIIPKLNLDVETDFSSADTSYHMLLRICAVINKLGYGRTTVFFDKFDEDSRMENNAEVISDFIVNLLTDNKLLENPDIQFIISVWEVPFKRILGTVRTQKHYCPLLSWPTPYLVAALNKRISAFSNDTLHNFRTMFAEDICDETINEILYLSNGNPRDLWHILDHIFHSQYSIDPNCMKLSNEAVHQGLSDFVVHFNFYEYYPKKPKAKANTMDVYSYIKHLQKLPSETFTKNQLNELAKTGSSTNNYVVGMEAIGLVVNTKEKLNAGVVYRINDPKVVYAIKNRLDISRV